MLQDRAKRVLYDGNRFTHTMSVLCYTRGMGGGWVVGGVGGCDCGWVVGGVGVGIKLVAILFLQALWLNTCPNTRWSTSSLPSDG